MTAHVRIIRHLPLGFFYAVFYDGCSTRAPKSACTVRVFTMPVLWRLFCRSFDHRPDFFCSTAGLFFFMAWRACQSNTAMNSIKCDKCIRIFPSSPVNRTLRQSYCYDNTSFVFSLPLIMLFFTKEIIHIKC